MSPPYPPLPDPSTLDLAPQAPIPVCVLSGFLGSGKTTLLNQYLREPGMAQTAIIVNEIGEIGLDHLLVEGAAEDTVLLGNGCLCCSLQGDLVRTLRKLLERSARGEVPAYRQVVVETSGLAEPAPILQTLMSDPLRLSRYHFSRLAVTADAQVGASTLARFETARRQVAMADVVIVTKTDAARERDHRSLLRTLSELTRSPVRSRAAVASVAELLFGNRSSETPGEIRLVALAHEHAASGRFRVAARWVDAALAPARIEGWLAELVARWGDRLLRTKGILRVAADRRPLVFHTVQHVVSPFRYLESWPDARQRGVAVAIGCGMEQIDLERALDGLESGPRSQSPNFR